MKKKSFSTAVIGGGPAGSFSSIFASEYGSEVVIFDKNHKIGGKLPVTGNSRCNITNESISQDNYVGENNDFVRNVFARFSAESLIDYFKELSVSLYREKDRYYPSSGKSSTIIDALEKKLKGNRVELMLNSSVESVSKIRDSFIIESSCGTFSAKSLIICTGGKSYSKIFGSGGGFSLAEQLGHSVRTVSPGLTSFIIKENRFKSLMGVSLEVSLSLHADDRKIFSRSGPILFTHFGVSGPLVMDCSNRLAQFGSAQAEIVIDFLNNAFTDFKSFYEEMSKSDTKRALRFLSKYIPNSLAALVLSNLSINSEAKTSEIKKTKIRELFEFLSECRIIVSLNKNFDEAQVTVGGVKTGEINPRTMESKIVKNLYFAGEVIDIAGDCGGYNLQFAFSTGYIAGKSSSEENNHAQMHKG